MIEANKGLLDSLDQIIAKSGEVKAALDSIPDRVETVATLTGEDEILEQVAEIREYLDAIPDHKTVLITIGETGDTGDAANAINDLTDALGRNAEAWSRVEDVGRDYSVMMGETIADADHAAQSIDRVFSVSEGGVAEQLSVAEATGRVVDAMHEEAQATVDLHSGMAYTVADMALLAAALGSTVTDAAGATRAIGGVGSAVADAGTIVASQGGAIANFWTTWGKTIHWVVAGGSELLAVVVPAMVALGTGALAAAEGATWLGDKMEGVYTVTEATAPMLNTTAGEALGLAGKLQQAQTAADPGVYELLGAGLNIAKEAFGQFASEGLDVVHVLDAFSAKLVLEFGQGGALSSAMDELTGKGVQDLTQLGQIFGNLTHFITSLAGEMPGLAEVVLRLFDDFTKLLSVITGDGGAWVTFAMGIEEAWRWGSLLSNVMGYWVSRLAVATQAFSGFLSKLSGAPQTVEEITAAFRSQQQEIDVAAEAYARYDASTAEAAAATAGLTEDQSLLAGSMRASADASLALAEAQKIGAASDAELALGETGLAGAADAAAGGLSTAADFLLGPWGFAIAGAVAGAVILIKEIGNIKTAAQQLTSSMESAIDKASLTQGLTDILVDLPQLQAKLSQAEATAQGFGMTAATSAGQLRQQVAAVNTARDAVGTYQAAIAGQVGQAVDILSLNTKIGGSYYSLSTAMALAAAAGVNVGSAFNKQGQMAPQAKQQVLDLIEGYKEMDQTGTTLANDINAVSEQALMQQTDVSKLNQAWDGFISDMTGVSSSVASLYTDLTTIGNVTEVATSKIQAFSQGNTGLDLSVKQVAQALSTFGAGSAQVWSNFDSAVGQAEQALDGIRTAAAAGGVTNDQYQESVKGIVAQLLPYAQYSSTATSELSALAQQAGGPATTNFGRLSQWVGNTKNATSGLNSTVQSATQYMSNLGNVAANLASTLDSAVASAISEGTINIKGIADASQQFETALQGASGEINGPVIGSLQGMISQLEQAGEPANDIKAIIDQIATRAGITGGALNTLNNYVDTFDKVTGTAASGGGTELTSAIEAIGTKGGATALTLAGQLISTIEQTGSTADSASTKLENELVKALEASGLGAQAAAKLVHDLEVAIDNLPTSKTVTIDVNTVTTGGTSGTATAVGGGGHTIQGNAAGGVIPGYDPGHDSVLAMLSPGEGILTPQATRMIGGGQAIHAINAAARHYADGGIASAIAAFEATGSFGGTGAASSPAGASSALGSGIPAPSPLPPQFLGDWLPSSLTGAGGSVASAGGGTTTIEGIQPIHVHVTLDGRQVWEATQKETLKMNLRNNGVATGLMKPR